MMDKPATRGSVGIVKKYYKAIHSNQCTAKEKQVNLKNYELTGLIIPRSFKI